MKLQALVLLGCRVGAGNELSPAAARRTERAAQAYAAGLAPLVVASGGRRWGQVCEAEALSQALQRLGVPEQVIVREMRSMSTCENALFSAALLRERGIVRVGVVTCDWHLRRALACFRRAGLDAEGLPARSPPAPLARTAWRSLREWLGLRLDGTATWGCRAC